MKVYRTQIEYHNGFIHTVEKDYETTFNAILHGLKRKDKTNFFAGEEIVWGKKAQVKLKLLNPDVR